MVPAVHHRAVGDSRRAWASRKAERIRVSSPTDRPPAEHPPSRRDCHADGGEGNPENPSAPTPAAGAPPRRCADAVCFGDPEGCITWLSTVRTIMSATRATRCALSRGAAIASRPETIEVAARSGRSSSSSAAAAARCRCRGSPTRSPAGGRSRGPARAPPRDACSTAATGSSGCASKAISTSDEEALQLVGHDRLGERRLRADLVVDGLPAHPDLLGEAAHGHRRPAVSRCGLDGRLDDAAAHRGGVNRGGVQPCRAPLASCRRAFDALEVRLVAHAAVRAAPVLGHRRPGGSGGEALARVADGLVVDVPASGASDAAGAGRGHDGGGRRRSVLTRRHGALSPPARDRRRSAPARAPDAGGRCSRGPCRRPCARGRGGPWSGARLPARARAGSSPRSRSAGRATPCSRAAPGTGGSGSRGGRCAAAGGRAARSWRGCWSSSCGWGRPARSAPCRAPRRSAAACRSARGSSPPRAA